LTHNSQKNYTNKQDFISVACIAFSQLSETH